MLLAGDIGGTKTNLAIYREEGDHLATVVQRTFPSGRYPSLEAICREFLADQSYRLEWASFGVAGPVVGGRARITNLPWEMDERDLGDDLGLPPGAVTLLNDLEAIAYGIPHLGLEDLHTLNAGQPEQEGALAVIAPGTGLGEAFLTWESDHRYHVHASEGGHVDFGPTDVLQVDLLRYLLAQKEHVSYERVCSGMGLPNIYAFLRDTGRAIEPAWLAEALAVAHDQTPVIVSHALDEAADCSICRQTLELFVAILAAEAGNMALKVMATGGVYLGGGIPPRILPHLETAAFLAGFRAKGRFAELLARIPVHVILNPEIALTGAAWHGHEASRAAAGVAL